MVATSEAGGHPAEFREGAWVYAETGLPVADALLPCATCHRQPGVLHLNGRLRDIDACILPLVEALNAAGLSTVASCCGHGHRPARISLKDGREIFIVPDFETAAQVDRLFPVDINGNRVARPAR